MTASSVEQASTVCWFWKSNPNPWSKTEPAEWSRFSDIDNEIIEKAYQQKKNEVMIENNYKIDFKHKMQVHISDKSRQRPICRETVESNELFTPREQRFNGVDLPSKTFEEGSAFSKYIWEWANQYNNSCYMLTEEDAPRVVKLAAAGISEEAELCTKPKDKQKGNELAQKLRAVANNSLSDIGKQCIYSYTVECFLYHVLNDILRREDLSKLKTLGPFCFLLQNALWNCRETVKHTQQRVYRGGKYKKEHIQQYKAAVGQTRCWSAFSSTTKVPSETNTFIVKPADDEIPTLFIITIIDRPFTESFGLDISSMSAIKKEAEVLLPAGISFIINQVDYDEAGKKCTIFLTI